jgi:coenzyme F420 hydrogenase subunit beta
VINLNKSIRELFDTVVENDYCIGCGACASVEGSPLTMKFDKDGKLRPFLDTTKEMDDKDVDVLSVCPFSNESKNETELGAKIFSQENNISYNEFTGHFINCYAAYVKAGEFRQKGSSGGMGSWIASQLLKHNLVDGVIHVKGSKEDTEKLFEYQISNNENELLEGAKSKYYPIEMSQVMKFIKQNSGRYALIGVPCFIKAVRLLAEKDETIKSQIKFTIGLVCGHLKSDMFAKSMGWQMGINPENLETIDFRKKLEGRAASNYGVEVVGTQNGKLVAKSAPTRELYTTNWGHGLFKYNACDYCDDVLAETADITVGDAWLPQYVKDSMGTNIVIVRNPVIQKLVDENSSELYIDKLSAHDVYESQAGGFRHRREGLAYRLYLKDQKEEWRPEKRVKPNNNISSKRKKIYEKRVILVKESFTAFKIAEEKKEFNTFIDHMDPIIKDYNKTVAPSVFERVLGKVKRAIKNKIR